MRDGEPPAALPTEPASSLAYREADEVPEHPPYYCVGPGLATFRASAKEIVAGSYFSRAFHSVLLRVSLRDVRCP